MLAKMKPLASLQIRNAVVTTDTPESIVYIHGCLKIATFGKKMTVTGMYLRYVNVLLLYYPFVSNHMPCLGCATQQMWSTVLQCFPVAACVAHT